MSWSLAGPMLEAVCLMSLRIRSMVRLKMIGLKGHPCLTPERTGISGVRLVWVRIFV